MARTSESPHRQHHELRSIPSSNLSLGMNLYEMDRMQLLHVCSFKSIQISHKFEFISLYFFFIDFCFYSWFVAAQMRLHEVFNNNFQSLHMS